MIRRPFVRAYQELRTQVRSCRNISSKPPKHANPKYNSFSRSHMKSHSPTSSGISQPKGKYIPFEQFPKAPDNILNLSVEELLSNINMKPMEKPADDKKHFIEFEIPEKFFKSNRKEEVTAKDKELVEELDRLLSSNDEMDSSRSQLSMLKLYYDQDTDLYQPLPEHTLKKSLSGMIKLNPCLEEIDDAYLWQLFPKGKTFGVPPFEQKLTKDGFKKWERDQIKALEKEKEKEARVTKEFEEFKEVLNASQGLFKTRSQGRRKLDRKLLKRYKDLKKEGKIPQDFILSKLNDDENNL